MRTFLADLNQMVMVVIMIMTISCLDGGAQHVYFPECYPTDLYRCRASFPSLRQKKYFQARKVLLLPLIRDLMVTEPFQMISNLVKS